MKLTLEGVKNRKVQEEADISLPSYDVEAMAEATREKPVWIHFGADNIFHTFIGGIAGVLISEGMSGKGITCTETFNFDVIEKIYKPYDSLVLGVTLKADGSADKKVIGSLTETLKAQTGETRDWERLRDIFADPGSQIVPFTITEKGYALKKADGAYFPFIQADIDNRPENAIPAIAVTCSLLYERYKTGKAPLAMISMDSCSHNGEKLQESVTAMAKGWNKREYVEDGFIAYLSDHEQVSFPRSMINGITSRPADFVQAELENARVENMTLVITSRNTYIAPFVNTEGPQYLIIEGCFPNGRPALERAGVYMTDRDTVNKVGRMKVTTYLNLLHTALAVHGCVLGYTPITGEIKDPLLNKLVRLIDPGEGVPVMTGPGILSPENFVNEVINVRIPNPLMPDAPQRIATGTSQKVGARYGETIEAYMSKYRDAGELTAIPLAIVGWCRYLPAADDGGEKFELSAGPMVSELTKALEGIVVGRSEIHRGQLESILSSVSIFGTGFYEVGIGETVKEVFREEAAGPGAVRAVLKKYLNA